MFTYIFCTTKFIFELKINYTNYGIVFKIKVIEVGHTVHTVRSGEVLSGIASEYGTTVGVVSELNNIKNPNAIYAGQKFKIRKSGRTPKRSILKSGTTSPKPSGKGHYFKSGDLDKIIGKLNVGNGQCVVLAQHYLGRVGTWGEGPKITRSSYLGKGCSIATFFDGRYPNWSTGNHGCFFHWMSSEGMYVVDQYCSSGGIHKRLLRFTGKGGISDAGGYSIVLNEKFQ